IYYWWQAGATEALKTLGFELTSNKLSIVGASAGSLSATLAATGVDANTSLDLALALCDEYGVWEKGGLQFVWGGMVRQWLEELLPHDAAEICRDRVHIHTLRLLPPKKLKISDFSDKDDLIEACMASVHIPWFMDKHFSARYRGNRYIDGSWRLSDTECSLGDEGYNTVWLDYARDDQMSLRKRDFLKLTNRDGLEAMMESGY
ncbi:unnamed protein product, partial [Chrysoparadoxa australica]